jgi:hypothetical protein
MRNASALLDGFGPISRVVGLAAAAGMLVVTVLSARWLIDSFQSWAVVAMLACAVATAVGISWVAVRGGERAARRLAWELVALGTALIAAELLIQATTAGADSDDPLIQRREAREHAARRHGVDFDARSSWQVVQTLRAKGADALLGIPRSMVGSELVRDRLPPDFYPLGHASNAEIVECNEGPIPHRRVWLQQPARSRRVARRRSRRRRRIVGARAVRRARQERRRIDSRAIHADREFRGYRSEDPVAARDFSRIRGAAAATGRVWFANTTFAEPKEEAREPLLLRYLDPSFSQDLRNRQPEIDAALREVIAPLGYASLQRSERVHADVTRRLLRILRLPNVRRVVAPAASWRRPGPLPELDHFKAVLQLASHVTSAWGGRLVVVVLPSTATRPVKH